MPFQLFHELADQIRWVFYTDVRGLTLEDVPNADRNWYVHVLKGERGCRLLPLVLVTVRLKIVQERVQWCALFHIIMSPHLDNAVANSVVAVVLIHHPCAAHHHAHIWHDESGFFGTLLIVLASEEI